MKLKRKQIYIMCMRCSPNQPFELKWFKKVGNKGITKKKKFLPLRECPNCDNRDLRIYGGE